MIDTSCETWGDVLRFLREQRDLAQDTVNSPETPDNLTNFNRGILWLAEQLTKLPHRKAPAIEGRTA